MASVARSDLKVAYELGSFIISQVPHLDDDHEGHPWAQHKGYFESGPNHFRSQMKQGILLKVDNDVNYPNSVCTRYGEWSVLGSMKFFGRSFDKIFHIVKEKLQLRKIEELSTEATSYWAVESWNGEVLDEPILADERAGEYIPYEVAKTAYREFLKTI